MTKNEICELIQRNGFAKTDYRNDLEEIISERERTKHMYFWRPDSSASGRRSSERRLSINLCVKIADDVEVLYSRDVSMSCRHVYATDSLRIVIDDTVKKVTIADLKKLIDAFPENAA